MTAGRVREQLAGTARVRVVLVDDTPDIRLLLRVALEHRGPFEVVGEAGDGRTGVDLARELQPDLVLLDLAMPVMDGMEALPLVLRAAPDARVIVVSGLARAEMADDALAAGAAGYVQKGASITKVVAQIAEIMGLRAWTVPQLAPSAPPSSQEEIERLHVALAAAAHELRGPATVLLAMCELLSTERATISEQSFDRMLDAIERQARVLDRVTDDLLASTQAERGVLSVDPEPVRLRPTLESAAVAIAARESVLIECPEQLWALADPARAQQVVGNLLSNALKYGRPPIEISAAAHGDEVQVRVLDHGDGVPPEFEQRLFEQFTRAPSVGGKGIGLGLYVVRSLVDAQGGRVWFEPVPSGGAAFCFTLPVSAAAEDDTVSQFPHMWRSRP